MYHWHWFKNVLKQCRGEGIPFKVRANFLVTMSQWSGEHRAFAIEAFFKSDSFTTARRKFCTHYKIKRLSDAPSVALIRQWVKKFRETGSANNLPRPGPSCTSRTPENILQVQQSLRENPGLSLRKRAASLKLSKSTVHKILMEDIKYVSNYSGFVV